VLSDPLSATFAALADPTRRAILARLASGEASVTELAEPFAMSMPAVSKHLKVLERAGLVARGREAQWRPRRLDAAPLKDVDRWLEDYRRFWRESLDRLDEYLRELKEEEASGMASNESGAAPPSPSPPAERVLHIARGFDAPCEAVWKAWTDPARAARWAGPHGFTATRLEGDLRPGGAWRTCLRRDADGEELWQGGVYREVAEPERLAFTFAWDGADGRPGPETLVTITFAEHADGATRMAFRQAVFDTEANRNGHRERWNEAFDRLASHLASEAGEGGR
jgi:uncharacterized protein YndB with AHSA1/START domain/DNA-binding transcriptional ArsR family regulator